MHQHECMCMSRSIVSVCDLSLQEEAAERCGNMHVVLVGLKALEATDLVLLACGLQLPLMFNPFPAKEFVLLMQFLPKIIWQRDSAEQKRSVSSTTLQMMSPKQIVFFNVFY